METFKSIYDSAAHDELVLLEYNVPAGLTARGRTYEGHVKTFAYRKALPLHEGKEVACVMTLTLPDFSAFDLYELTEFQDSWDYSAKVLTEKEFFQKWLEETKAEETTRKKIAELEQQLKEAQENLQMFENIHKKYL